MSVMHVKPSRIWQLVGAGVALVVAAWAAQIVTTGKLAAWQASRMSDRQLERAVAAPGAGFAASLEWGARLERAGRMLEAKKAYEQAANADASRPAAWIGWGRTAYAEGDWKAADRVLQKCVELWPKNAEARFLWAAELNDTFRFTAAREQLAAGLRLEPARPGAWRSLGELDMRLKRYPDAVDDYRRAAVVDHATPGGDALRGWALLRANRLQEAIPRLRAAVAQNPSDFDARFHLGEALAGTGRDADRSEAVQEFNRVMSFSDRKSRAFVAVAKTWISTGSATDALESLERAVSVNSFDSDALQMLVDLYRKQGRAVEAAGYQKQLDRVKRLEKQRDEDLARIDAAGAATEALGGELIRAGRDSFSLGRLPESRLAFQAGLHLAPDNAEGARGIQLIDALYRRAAEEQKKAVEANGEGKGKANNESTGSSSHP